MLLTSLKAFSKNCTTSSTCSFEVDLPTESRTVPLARSGSNPLLMRTDEHSEVEWQAAAVLASNLARQDRRISDPFAREKLTLEVLGSRFWVSKLTETLSGPTVSCKKCESLGYVKAFLKFQLNAFNVF